MKKFTSMLSKNKNPHMSLYDYLERAAGPDLGKEVFKAAKDHKDFIKVESKDVDTPYYQGKVLTYPLDFLDEYFKTPEDEVIEGLEEDDELPF